MQVNLPIKQHLAILEALESLNDCDFGDETGKTVYQIARNIRKLREVRETVDTARQATFKRFAGDRASIPSDSPEAVQFNAALAELLGQAQAFDLHPIEFAALKPSSNKIPPGALAWLDPIITDAPDIGETAT